MTPNAMIGWSAGCARVESDAICQTCAIIYSQKYCNGRLQEGLFYHYFYEAAGRSCFRINFVSEKSDCHASIALWEVVVWQIRGCWGSGF